MDDERVGHHLSTRPDAQQPRVWLLVLIVVAADVTLSTVSSTRVLQYVDEPVLPGTKRRAQVSRGGGCGHCSSRTHRVVWASLVGPTTSEQRGREELGEVECQNCKRRVAAFGSGTSQVATRADHIDVGPLLCRSTSPCLPPDSLIHGGFRGFRMKS